jgi:S1-C subfamily serine protease
MPGMSGGGVFNSKGELIGINVATLENYSFAEKISFIRSRVEQQVGVEMAKRMFSCSN